MSDHFNLIDERKETAALWRRWDRPDIAGHQPGWEDGVAAPGSPASPEESDVSDCSHPVTNSSIAPASIMAASVSLD